MSRYNNFLTIPHIFPIQTSVQKLRHMPKVLQNQSRILFRGFLIEYFFIRTVTDDCDPAPNVWRVLISYMKNGFPKLFSSNPQVTFAMQEYQPDWIPVLFNQD